MFVFLPLLFTVFISPSFSLSVLGRVFLPRPLMASFFTSSTQAWPSPLKNTALSLVPLATTQVQGWWTSSWSAHLLGHIYGTIGSRSDLVFFLFFFSLNSRQMGFQLRVRSWTAYWVTFAPWFIEILSNFKSPFLLAIPLVVIFLFVLCGCMFVRWHHFYLSSFTSSHIN